MDTNPKDASQLTPNEIKKIGRNLVDLISSARELIPKLEEALEEAVKLKEHKSARSIRNQIARLKGITFEKFLAQDHEDSMRRSGWGIRD